MSDTPARSSRARVRLDRILCPVDLSEISKHALRHARALAGLHDAALTVLEVVWAGLPPIAMPGSISGGSTRPLLSAADRSVFVAELEAFSQPAAGEGTPPTTVTVAEGPILPTILKTADEMPADLIVLGTHGSGGFDKLLLGSVAEKVLRKARCPVLTIPPHTTDETPATRYKTIVVAVDFSPASLVGVDYALSLAQESSATLLLVHVIEGDGAQDAALRSLRAAIPEDCRDWCTPEEIVVTGKPHEELVRIANARQVDVIVIGVHGRSTLNLAFFGSTTTQVVRHAHCPVLTVRA